MLLLAPSEPPAPIAILSHGDHKSSTWFSTTDRARELVCADVALSGNHCELRKRLLWKLLARAEEVIE